MCLFLGEKVGGFQQLLQGIRAHHSKVRTEISIQPTCIPLHGIMEKSTVLCFSDMGEDGEWIGREGARLIEWSNSMKKGSREKRVEAESRPCKVQRWKIMSLGWDLLPGETEAWSLGPQDEASKLQCLPLFQEAQAKPHSLKQVPKTESPGRNQSVLLQMGPGKVRSQLPGKAQGHLF